VASPITSQYFKAYRLLRKGLGILYSLKVRILSTGVASISIEQLAVAELKVNTTKYLGETI
jgi:hypothetical protein